MIGFRPNSEVRPPGNPGSATVTLSVYCIGQEMLPVMCVCVSKAFHLSVCGGVKRFLKFMQWPLNG